MEHGTHCLTRIYMLTASDLHSEAFCYKVQQPTNYYEALPKSQHHTHALNPALNMPLQILSSNAGLWRRKLLTEGLRTQGSEFTGFRLGFPLILSVLSRHDGSPDDNPE